MNQPTILLSPLKAAVPAAGGTLDLLVRIRAPEQVDATATQPHLPKRLSLVVDRSGSMSGQPLAEALRCAMHIARHLTPQDQVSLVVYDDQVQVLQPLAAATAQTIERMQSQADLVDSGGSTALFDGWDAGARQLVDAGDVAGAADSARNSLSRVILLSDGQANHGLVDIAQIEQHCRRMAERGVTTTTVGLGRGFNEDLMIAMAHAGGGQQYYGQTAEDLFDSFDEELALLQATCLRHIQVKLLPAAGVIVEMLSPAQVLGDHTWRANDLALGAESWLAVRLHVGAAAVAEGTLRDLLAVSVKGMATDGQPLELTSGVLSLPAAGAASLAAMAADDVVQRRLDEMAFATASSQLRQLARSGDLPGMKKLMKDLERRFGHHPWLAEKIEQLRRLAEQDMVMMEKEVSYSVLRMSKRSVALQEMRFGKDETDAVMPAYLRRKVTEGRGKQR